MQQTPEQLRTLLLEKLNACVGKRISTDTLLAFARVLKKKPEVHTDIPLSNCVAILEFLDHQIAKGNADLLTRDLVEESYMYIMNKLVSK